MHIVEHDALFAEGGSRVTTQSFSEACNRAGLVFNLSSICTVPIPIRPPN